MLNGPRRFLGTGGRVVDHVEGCDRSAGAIPGWEFDGYTEYPEARECTPDDLNLCTPECAEAWGIRTPAEPMNCGTD